MELGYNSVTPEESLWWESNECSQEEWKFLCKLFGLDPKHTQIIKVVDYTVESFIVEEEVNDFCLEEDSIFL
jgi:hypothetical protein